MHVPSRPPALAKRHPPINLSNLHNSRPAGADRVWGATTTGSPLSATGGLSTHHSASAPGVDSRNVGPTFFLLVSAKKVRQHKRSESNGLCSENSIKTGKMALFLPSKKRHFPQSCSAHHLFGAIWSVAEPGRVRFDARGGGSRLRDTVGRRQHRAAANAAGCRSKPRAQSVAGFNFAMWFSSSSSVAQPMKYRQTIS